MKAFSLLLALVLLAQPFQAPGGADTFDVEMLMTDKAGAEGVSLRFTEDQLNIEARCRCAIIKEFTYSDIKGAQYSRKERLLTIKTESDSAALRLDENNYRAILKALESRTKVKVETMGEDKQK
jgi:hypothetical protein